MMELHAQHIPLAELLRPEKLEDYLGQEHLTGEDAILSRVIAAGKIPSMILWGPPGTGKTTLARIIAREMGLPFFTLSAISSGVKEVRQVIQEAREAGGGTILFIDEIHRFSKSQQDSLLGAAEDGTLTLIGATTENPSFEVISPLLSRCQVYILKSLQEDDLRRLLEKGSKKMEVITGKTIRIIEENALLRISGGDARKLYNALELVAGTLAARAKEAIDINDKVTLEIVQQNLALYDKGGEMHYDVISAFIKCIRGSDPDAAVYWLARMVEGGEDVRFIARRMLILAAEDIGLANPNALLLAQACFDAVNVIGWPESRIILSETVIYLATSPKSNSAYMAIKSAQSEVRKSGDLPVPLHLRNAPTKLMEETGYGKGYKYAHDFQGNFTQQDYLPEGIRQKKFYEPGNNPREEEIRKQLHRLWDSGKKKQ
jgi:putative ATPase